MVDVGREPLRPLDIEPDSENWRYSITKDGQALNLFRVLAHNPPVLRAYSRLGAVVIGSGIPRTVVELVILRVAAHNKSTYEIARHRILCRSLGIADMLVERVLNITVSTVGQDEQQRVAVNLVDELESTSDVSDELWARLTIHFAADEILDLIVLIGQYRTTAYILSAARVPMDPDVLLQQQ
jgi:alkylhydroperoxidase family enzyme